MPKCRHSLLGVAKYRHKLSSLIRLVRDSRRQLETITQEALERLGRRSMHAQPETISPVLHSSATVWAWSRLLYGFVSQTPRRILMVSRSDFTIRYFAL